MTQSLKYRIAKQKAANVRKPAMSMRKDFLAIFPDALREYRQAILPQKSKGRTPKGAQFSAKSYEIEDMEEQ